MMTAKPRLGKAPYTAAGPAERAAAINPDIAADQLSANAFFNALLRESSFEVWGKIDGKQSLTLNLPKSGNALILDVAYRSTVGRHLFRLPLRVTIGDGAPQDVTLETAIEWLLAEPSLFPQANADQRQRFVKRCQSSFQNMRDVVAARAADISMLFAAPLNFVQSEQGLLCGHPVHPVPKSRDPFNLDQAQRYAPEFGGDFSLVWLAVDRRCLTGASSEAGDFMQGFAELWQQDLAGSGVQASIPEGFAMMPAHPWQWQQLQGNTAIQGMLDRGEIVPLMASDQRWRATSSLRAVHNTNSVHMLKFSLSLRLTNSLRVLLPKEMLRGLEVTRIRATPVGREFQRRYPHFHILAEPGFAMLKPAGSDAGLPESLVMLRENPFYGAAAENTCLLATLTQDAPDGGLCRAARLVQQLAAREGMLPEQAALLWFQRFLERVVEPLLIAQADYGLLYGAHQQNLILGFDQELPCKAWFRDCQGTAYSRLGIERLMPYLPELGRASENILNDEMANRLFVYYLFINSTFGLISALASSGLCREHNLLGQLRALLLALNAGPRRDRSCLDYLLEADQLWSKGNFLCAVVDLNESTTDDPLAIYHPVANPLKSCESGAAA